MRVEVLGFAGAAPLQGGCPSYLVGGEHTTLLLDCGPGALERLWARGLVHGLDAIVISHMHADHVLDLLPYAGDVVRELPGGRRTPLYVPRGDGPEVLRRLDAVFARDPDATATRFDAAFEVREYDAGEHLQLGELALTFAATEHAQPCFAARVSDGASTVVYGADGALGEPIVELARGADLLILEASFLDDEAAAREHRHMTAGQAGAVAARAGAGQLLLTHTFAGVNADGLLERAALSFDGPVAIAHDGYSWQT
jgi:ribonuclease BN (tRNA processing enzyme)